jgi:hypothetical protein
MRTMCALILLSATAAAQIVRPVQHTNGVVVTPTNFWSADATNARAGLGLGWSALTNTNAGTFRAAIGLAGSGFASFNSGSSGNSATGEYASTVGGALNTASGNYSFAAGRNAKATNQGAFVWADSQTGNFSSTNSNSFNVRASGGLILDLGTTGIVFRSGADQTRVNLGLGSAATNNASDFQAASAALTNLAANNAASLTNFPPAILQSNTALTSFPAALLRTNGSATALTNFPTLNQNTTGTAANVTDVVALANGGTGATNQAGARSAIGLGAAWLTNATAPLQWVPVPAATNSAGDPGQVAYTNNHFYICVATNAWRRVQLGTW